MKKPTKVKAVIPMSKRLGEVAPITHFASTPIKLTWEEAADVGLIRHRDLPKKGREAYFEIVPDWGITKTYHARLRGANGEVIAWTETYTRKANALKAIKLVQASAGAKVVDLTVKTKGAK